MTKEEQLTVDMQQIEQVTLHQGWRVVVRRIEAAIAAHMDAILVAPVTEKEKLCQKVLAYKELLDLPGDIAQQFKEMTVVSTDTPPAD